jgi:hypothetical protein
MKIRPLLLGLAFSLLASFLPAQEPVLEAAALRSPEEIERLVGPIALYPDPLVALILPASTHPSDIVLAARFLDRGGSAESAATQPWDESVRSLARYREVVVYLDQHLDWTRELGACFLDQPDEVMNAIQAVRVRARSSGMLADTPQQQVIVESDEIRILPATPTVIFVPRYDPQIIFVPRDYWPSSWISFGIGYSVGPWLSYDCDWRARHVRIHRRPPTWYYQPDWRRRHYDHSWTRWTPPSRHRDHDRRRHADRRLEGDRRWNPSPSIVGSTPHSSPDRRADAAAPRRRYDRDGDGGRERRGYPERHRRPDTTPSATAPIVNSTPPPAVTAPEVVTRPPQRVAPTDRPWTERRRGDGARPEQSRRDDRPRRDYSPPATAPSAAPVIAQPPAPRHHAGPRGGGDGPRPGHGERPARVERSRVEDQREQLH